MKQIACLSLAFTFAISANAQLSFTTLNSSTTANLPGVSFADTSVGYVCGENGTILKTGNGSTTWTSTAVSGSVFLDKISMVEWNDRLYRRNEYFLPGWLHSENNYGHVVGSY